MNEELITNHNMRIVSLATSERVLCLFGEIKDKAEKVAGYRMGDRWCPYSPIEDHRISGEHIISVVYPDNNIVKNYADRLKEIGLKDEQIFYEEKTDGDSSESTATSE